MDQQYLDDDEGRALPTPLDWACFVLGAVRRRKWVVVAVFAVIFGAAVAVFATWPRTYRVETRLLAQKQQALASISRPTMDDVPTRTAWDLVHRRENLVSVVKQTLDPRTTPQARDPRWIGALKAALRLTPGADPDPVNVLVTRLERALDVSVGEGTITIAVEWPDPVEAYRLVEALQQNFLEARHVQEITGIDDVISMLQGRAATLREELDKAIEEVRRSSPLPVSDVQQPRPATPLQPTEDVARLKAMLEAKERAVRDVEEFRRRRLADLQAQLDEKRAIYSDSYPAVVTLRQDIDALSQESPQIAALRADERKLRDEYLARVAATQRDAPSLAPGQRSARVSEGPAGESERVREARAQYQRMSERVVAAQIDLDAARAAFKSRYNVIWPPEIPKAPVSPNPVKYLGAGLLASLLLAIAAAATLDVIGDRVVERWQVERALGLEVLSDLGRK